MGSQGSLVGLLTLLGGWNVVWEGGWAVRTFGSCRVFLDSFIQRSKGTTEGEKYRSQSCTDLYPTRRQISTPDVLHLRAPRLGCDNRGDPTERVGVVPAKRMHDGPRGPKPDLRTDRFCSESRGIAFSRSSTDNNGSTESLDQRFSENNLPAVRGIVGHRAVKELWSARWVA